MNLVFFDLPQARTALKPFTFTRPVAELRVGILTLREKWQQYLAEHAEIRSISFLTEEYLRSKYPLAIAEDTLLINPAVCPSASLAEQVVNLSIRQSLRYSEGWAAARVPRADFNDELLGSEQREYASVVQPLLDRIAGYKTVEQNEKPATINHTWDIFAHNAAQIQEDYHLITAGRSSHEIDDPYTQPYRPDQIFVEEGASVRAAIISAEEGPVYIGRGATVHEGAIIKGPFAMLEGSHVNMGSKIRDATTIGPNCKVGGEVKNTVFLANSNKGHEGFVGNSVVGEWCNFGADTNTSNLKNNYQSVRLWNYGRREYENTGQQFCGLMMGDHSKCSINTMFNTGTVVGVFANIFGTGFPAKFIPSFTWGGIQESNTYHLDKAIEVYERVLKRRNRSLSEEEVTILRHVFYQRSDEFPD